LGSCGRRRDVSLSNPAGAVSAGVPAADAAAGASVRIKDFNFGPAALTIHVGDAVTWLNQGPSSHTATASGIFSTGILRRGQSASYTFTHPGTFAYFCSIHRFMKASVTVLAASSPGPPGGSAGSNGPAGAGSAGANAGSGSPDSTGAGQRGSITPGSTLPNTGMNVLAEAVAGLVTMMLGSPLALDGASRSYGHA
jgi:plastocyanin